MSNIFDACAHDNLEIIKELLSKGADPNQPTENNVTSFLLYPNLVI